MAANQEDEGFEALLRPIQDLTRNWEVDLSLHLEEYLNYIRQMYGDNIPDMNFAQAAVLVQNSANIYSKKVDFLFTTVLQLLDTLSKKQKEAKNQENLVDDAGQPTGKRRKPGAVLETEEFVCFDELCSDRVTSSSFEKEKAKVSSRPKQKIVLNAAIKVKAKEKTSCNVYHCGHDVMGKKEEFRLHWRICSAGTLHEEFVIKKDRFRSLEPVEITVCGPHDDSQHDYDEPCSPHSDVGQPPPEEEEQPPPLATSLFNAAPIDRESEARGLGETKMRKEVANTVDIKVIEWQPNDFNANLTEKPIKKRKVVKIPPGLDDEKKRKHFQENPVYIFTITDVLFGEFKNSSFGRDLDFCCQSKYASKLKRQFLYQHRAKYEAYMEKEVGMDQIEDFHGFYNEDHDSDNENNFEGFGDRSEDGDALEVEVPLPEKDNILEPLTTDLGWKGDDVNTYDNEAMKTLEAYRSRKIDHGRITDMARRVEEWHQKITPKLEAAEQRSSFDIHAYGGKIIDAFSENIGCVKPFEDIVAGQSKEEVARYFLASLVLANQYNVEISESTPGDLNVDCVQLKLLSVVRHHEELDDNMRQTSDK